MTSPRPALCALVASLALAPSLAEAQRSAIVIVRAEGSTEAHDRARAGAIEALAEGAVRLVRTPDGAPCDEASCAAELAASAAVDVVLLIAVTDASARVVAVPLDGAPEERVEPIAEAGVGAAVGAAVERLLAQTAHTRAGFLVVRSVPRGASVRIDGRDAGVAPLRRSLSPGEHEVELRATGREPVTRTVVVEDAREAMVDIDFESDDDEEQDDGEDGAQAEAPGPTRTEPSPWNWALGGGLAIAGIVTLISPLTTLAREGECVEEIQDVGCVERVQFGPQSGVLLGLGAAFLVAAIVVDVTAPIRVEVQVSERAARLTVEGRF